MPNIYQITSSRIKQGGREDAEREVESIIQRREWEPKELYGDLLCAAACHNDIKTAEFCKDKGADLDYEDHRGKTPLWIANHFKQNQIAEALEKCGARKDTHDLWGKPSTSLESPNCSNQKEQSRHTKKSCRLM